MKKPLQPVSKPLERALELHWRTALVDTSTVRANLGLDAESIWALVDEGKLRWVWDIGTGHRIRILRFWAKELISREACADLDAAVVVDQVIGTRREHLRAGEVGQMLLCSRVDILFLHRAGLLEGPLKGHTRHITRASLASFLHARLCSPYKPDAHPIQKTFRASENTRLTPPGAGNPVPKMISG